MEKITELTQEQKEAIPAYIEKWIAIGLKTGETDWKTFDRFMPICYQKTRLTYPTRVVHVKSPLIGALASMIAEAIWRDRGAVDGAVGGAVREAVGGAVHGAKQNPLPKLVLSFVKEFGFNKKNLGWHYWIGGQFWIGGYYWGTAYSSFFFDVCGLKLSEDIHERAEAYRKICESVNYIWPNKDFVIVCARPQWIHRDTTGRLHSEHGMSIRYPDGWGLYHLHGVKFPEDIYRKIVNREYSAKEILRFTDIDQRVQAMKFAKDGLREFYRSEKGKVADTYEKVGINGILVRYELWDVPAGITFTKNVKFMIYDCPTALNRKEKREYSKGVPSTCKTVEEAMAWGISDDRHTVSEEDWSLMEPLVHES